MGGIETDYLVVGAGAAGMAFADALIAARDADVCTAALARVFTSIEPALAKLETFSRCGAAGNPASGC